VKLPRVRRVQLERMFARGAAGWRALRQIHPGARSIVQVSAPAYSPDALRALLYVYSTCDGRCGGGSLLWYERTTGRWRPSRSLFNVQH
jgi:hypothetical protein